MLNGNQYWPSLSSQMVRCSYKGRKVYTYTYAPKNLYADLHESVSKFPDHPAIIEENGEITTYCQFDQLVQRFSQYLYYDMGIDKGDFVGLILYNTLEFCVAFYALAKLGAVTVPMHTKQKPEEWDRQLMQLPMKLIIYQQKLETLVAETRKNNPDLSFLECSDDNGFSHLWEGKEYAGNPYSDTTWEDDLLVMFTSGTTARSKAVVLTNFNVVNSIMSYEKVLRITSRDKTIIATPIYHITGLVALLITFIHCGASVHLHRAFYPEKVLACAVEEEITLLHASPTVFIMLLEKSSLFPHIPSLRLFACGSANMSPEIIRKLHQWLPDMEFRTVYGLTESSASGSMFPDDASASRHIGSSGLPVPGLLMKLVDNNGQEVPEGETGELMLFGNVILDRYYNLESDTLSGNGWFKTGDIARFDKQGYVYIVDRKKDMINRGGEKVYSHDVESVLYRLEGVQEVAVIGVPDEKYGEVVMAVIRKRQEQPLTAEIVQEWVRTHMAKYAAPAYVEFVSELPTTANGKISKKTLRQLYGNAYKK